MTAAIGGCRCGHTRAMHPERTEEACISPECGCEEYIPAALSAPPVQAAPKLPTAGEPSALLALAKKSTLKRTVSLAEKVERLLGDLAGRVQLDAAQSEVREEVARLEAQLAAARAKLKGDAPTAASRPERALIACPDCDHQSPSAQGMAAHRRFNHKGEPVPDEVAIERAMAGDPPASLGKHDRAEAIRRLHDQGLNDREISQRLGMTHSATTQARLRADAKAS